MGAQMQRRAYSRVCGALTAKRPAALGYAVAGPVQRATGSPASATGQSVTGPAKLRRLPVYLRRHLLRPLFEAVGLGDQAGQGRQVVHPDRLHLFAVPLGDFLDVVDLAVEPLGKNGKDAVDPPLDGDRKSTRLNSSHLVISYAVFCLKKKKTAHYHLRRLQVSHN